MKLCKSNRPTLIQFGYLYLNKAQNHHLERQHQRISAVIHGYPPLSSALATLSGFAAAGARDPPPALICGAWEAVENQMHIWSILKNDRKEEKGWFPWI